MSPKQEEAVDRLSASVLVALAKLQRDRRIVDVLVEFPMLRDIRVSDLLLHVVSPPSSAEKHLPERAGDVPGKTPRDVFCPRCGKRSPSSHRDAGREAWYKAMSEYQPCCNPTCGGRTAQGCYHCHHPSYWQGKPTVDAETARTQFNRRVERNRRRQG